MSKVAPPYVGHLRTDLFLTATRNDSEIKICHMFNVKLVISPPKKFQRVLSRSSQLGGKKCGSLGV